jgi:hypothetical protein
VAAVSFDFPAGNFKVGLANVGKPPLPAPSGAREVISRARAPDAAAEEMAFQERAAQEASGCEELVLECAALLTQGDKSFPQCAGSLAVHARIDAREADTSLVQNLQKYAIVYQYSIN